MCVYTVSGIAMSSRKFRAKTGVPYKHFHASTLQMASTMMRFFFIHCRQNTYFIIGLCVGISFSLLLTPVLENECLFSRSQDFQRNKLSGLQDFVYNFESDEYKPVINLAGKPQKALKTPQMLLRPRYYSTELGIREKLFIGILTSQTTVESRAVSINKTISHIVDKVMYFLDAPGPQKLNISMSGIVGFTDSRKLLKPFHMLKYIIDNHLDDFDFFFFVHDSLYIKASKLYDLVHRVSVSEDVHAGSGKNDEHPAFCSLDAGLLLSNSVLRRVSENLDWCVKNAFSDSDGANVGRCIVHATNIPCQEMVQGQHFSNFLFPDNFNWEEDIHKLSKVPEFESALTIYPVVDPVMMYKLHAYFSKASLVEIKHQVSFLRHSISNMSAAFPNLSETMSSAWPVGNQPGNVPLVRFDVVHWDYFTENEIYLDSDFSNVKDARGADKLDIAYVLNITLMKVELHDEQLKFKRLVDGYRKFDPSRGMDYIFQLVFKDMSTGHEVYKRLQVCKPLGKVEVVPMPYVTENNRINLVLPVEAKTREQAKHFLEQYARVCMEKHDKTFLMMVLLYDPTVPGKGDKDDVFLDIKQMALFLSDKYKKDGSKIAWVSIKIPSQQLDSTILNFAITDLALKKFSAESLILLCHTNMELRQDYLNRVRMNTILNWQVFSPIPFTEFHPDIVYSLSFPRPQDLDINKNYGHYDSHQTDHIGFYVKDYLEARKKVEPLIPRIHSDHDIIMMMAVKYTGSGLQQEMCSVCSIYSMFVCASNLHVLRAVEPGLRLRHLERECSLSHGTYKYQQCIEERAFNLGFRNQLARLILDYRKSHLL